MNHSTVIAPLAAGTKKGYSLDRRFYCDDELFAADMDQVIGRKWIVAGHIDRVRRKGDYFLYKVGHESIIIIRSDASTINAFYNVCRHRGSLVCTEPSGRLARLTCGYHAWSYGLDGALIAARLMPDGEYYAPEQKRRGHAVSAGRHEIIHHERTAGET